MAYTYEHKYRLAQQFAKRWKDENRERAEKDTFWNEFFAIFNLDRYKTATTEYAIKHRSGGTKFADVFWAGKLLCEHKSAGKDLDAAYIQAMEYVEEIRRHNADDVPRYIIVSDFARLRLYDLQENSEAAFNLEELPQQIQNRHFDFMDGISRALKEAEEQANIEAAAAVGELYQAFKADGNYPEHDLKQFLIRLLFCFFADDTLIFDKDQFIDYLIKFTREDGADLGGALNRLFSVLNTPSERRPNGMPSELKAFPYVNGKLFEENLSEFYFNAELRDLLMACAQRDWSQISPEIFGNLFQSVMDNVERRELGAHYTEEANILKVIDGLFMDGLRQKFQAAQKVSTKNARRKAIDELHQSIGRLKFLDPACGCGNFLVVAYRELRRLEDDIIGELFEENQLLDISTMQRVHIGQFFGIEIDEYPAQIAKVAMWLTDHQCNRKTADRFGQTRPTIPLTDGAEIIHANSLRIDWPQADYIFGNPPFIGSTYQTAVQKADMQIICRAFKNAGILDYVANWYVKAAGIMKQNPNVQTAFVSTSSICQGQQVEALWGGLLAMDMEIHFAHRPFQWTSQAQGKAAVHCVIVGFRKADLNERSSFKYSASRLRRADCGEPIAASRLRRADCGEPIAAMQKFLFHYPDIKGQPEQHTAANINPYLIDTENLIIKKRSKPISGEADMVYGSKPTDGGYLLLSLEEKEALISQERPSEKYIRSFLGAEEFLNGKQRYCLWFADMDLQVVANDLQKMPQVAKRIENVKKMRAESTDRHTQKDAETPYLFQKIRQPDNGNYLLIPSVSSEKREFVPIGFLNHKTVCSNLVFSLPNATLYHFGILSSTMHNAFMRTVAGRLESRYRYSNTIVYNNFPFPFQAAEKEGEEAQKHIMAIEQAAQAILECREQYRRTAEEKGLPPPTLAELYNPRSGLDPYPKLRQAHAALDKIIDKAYGYQGKADDAERVAFLFERYQALVEAEAQAEKQKKSRKKAD